jgi:hypothetical protein
MIQLKKIKSTSTTTTTKDTSTSMRRPHKTNKIFFCLTTETIQQVMSYLTMPERFLFLSTNKKIYQEEPFAIKYLFVQNVTIVYPRINIYVIKKSIISINVQQVFGKNFSQLRL